MVEALEVAWGFIALAIILAAIPAGLLLTIALYRGAFDGEDPRIRRGWYADSDDVVAPLVHVYRWLRAVAARVAGWLW